MMRFRPGKPPAAPARRERPRAASTRAPRAPARHL